MDEASSIYINQLIYDLRRAGEDVIALSFGEAYFDIPMFDFSKLDVVSGYHYADSQGLPELRVKIAEYYLKHYGVSVNSASELLISAGSKPIIYMAMLTVLSNGDELLIHEPSWLSYPEQARLCGAVPKFVPYDCAVEDFEGYITNKTRMLIICNPNNPAGRVYSPDELARLYEICRARGIYLLVDEAYSDFVLSDGFVSIAEIVPNKDGIIVINSLSKNMGMSGWRIGYSIASSEFISHLLKVNQHLITCAPSILMQYCATYFNQIIGVTLPQVHEVVEKRSRVANMMDDLKIQCLPGASTFYFFVEIGNYPGTSLDFSLRLLKEKHVAVVPGSAYGESTERFLRISIGTESEERIWEALQIINEMLKAG